MNPSFGIGAPAVWASAVRAGIIASSSGNATVAPRPRSTVRRDRCFLVTNIVALLGNCSCLALPRASLAASIPHRRLRGDAAVVVGRRRAEPERLALRQRNENRREAIVLARRFPNDAPDGR